MAAVAINRPPAEVYQVYRRFDRLTVFMDYLESVEVTGPATSHWIARTARR